MKKYTFLVFFKNNPELGSHHPVTARDLTQAWLLLVTELIPNLETTTKIELAKEEDI